MPSQENGIPGDVSFASAVNITSSTNANPIVIRTSTAHNLTTGDEVHVALHQVNIAANGIWPATVVDTTHFSIPVDGTAFSAGGATGTVQSLAMGSTFQIPSDGDDDKAATFNVAYEALADRTAKLGLMTGSHRLVKYSDSIVNDSGNNPVLAWQTVSGIAATTWTDSGWAGIAIDHLVVDPVLGSDLVEIGFDGNVSSSVAGAIAAKMYVAVYEDGGSIFFTSAVGSAKSATIQASESFPISLHVMWTPATDTNVISVKVYLWSGSTGNISLCGDARVWYKVWRPTGKPQ